MSKLQPNFSWQKYEDEDQDSRQQFQYQMQQEHITVANAINTTVDDSSFFLRERQTSFTWVNSKPIFTLTLATTPWIAGGTLDMIPLPIVGNFVVINMVCCINNGTLSTSNTLLMPYLDVVTASNSIGILRSGTNIILRSGGANYSAYSGYVTVYYIKT